MKNTSTAGEVSPLSFASLLACPHVLIGGATGSGKSVLINGIMCELLRRPYASVILIDPKRVELSIYRRTRCACAYACTPSTALSVLSQAVAVMEYRYKVMERRRERFTHFAGVWIVIDEFADLIDAKGAYTRRIVDALKKLLRLGRAANVHVIAATQSPSRRTIPAEVVQNFTHRVALRCLSAIESRQIINAPGAETLPKYGRALVLSPDGLRLYSVPNCTDADAEKAIAAAPKRILRARAYIRG